jgi:predicted Zn finger-like uncharacterized protein
MSLLTRCPRCTTLFRVTPAQLQAKAGTVRCGRCMNVFDAYQALAPEQGNTLAAPALEPAAAPAAQPVVAAPLTATQAQVRNTSEAASAPMSGAAGAEVSRAASGGSQPPAVAAAAPPATSALRLPRPDLQRLLHKPTTAQLWSAAASALAFLLALQLVFGYRSELAARYPSARSTFTAICDRVGCSVPLPQRPDLVHIEASDVHMIDANRPQLIQLTATLRSYAGYDLAYPALDLVLTNANEHALARRVFTPDEYLDQTRDPQAGISANAEITVALDLDTGNLNAAGFRLDLLPAP